MKCLNIPVVIAGGSGSRLWPLSRQAYPKQFLPLVDQGCTMLQATLLRLQQALPEAEAPIIICHASHRFIVAEQCRTMSIQPQAIILEPEGKNTAPAVALAAEWVLAQQKEARLWVLPADHVMPLDNHLKESFTCAAAAADADRLVTFGVEITEPSTAYGYIQAAKQASPAQWVEISRFVEKPDRARAQAFQQSGEYFWNSGMFVFKASVYLTALDQYAKPMADAVHMAMQKKSLDDDFVRPQTETFMTCPADSIDYAVMEKASNCAMVPLRTAWSDVGSWDALMEQLPKNEEGNVCIGDVLTENVQDSYLHAGDRLLAVSGLDNVVVVETADAVLVADKAQSQSVKKLVAQLTAHSRNEAVEHRRVHRPWGWFETLVEGAGFKVKRISVSPGQALSLQRHQHRSEHWVVVKGTADVVNGEARLQLLADQSTYIPAQHMHQLANLQSTELEIIEVQTGSYLGEDDIERFADQYGRVEKMSVSS